MHSLTLITRNLTHYWRTNLAVVLGVGAAVAVLAGALLVGDSVRGSLRDLALARLGKTDLVIAASGFFRERLADDLRSHDRFAANFDGVCPIVALEAVVTRDENNARAGGAQIYGVDERFWKFHGANVQTPEGNDVLISQALAQELGAKQGDTLILRIEKPSAIPAESLHGRKDDLGRTVRLTMREILPANSLGEFSLRPQQGAVRAVFVELKKLQRTLDQDGKANAILLSAKSDQARQAIETMLKERFTLADLGLKLRALEAQQAVSLESDSAVISDTLAERAKAAAKELNLTAASFLTYLANTIRAGDREIPYSLVTGVDSGAMTEPSSVTINDWAARDLGVKPGDELTFEYYVWKDEGGLDTKQSRFKLGSVTPMQGLAADRDLAPEYPGITEAKSLADWDPPFPIELSRVRDIDEEYWDKYRTTPKAFIPLAAAQRLWGTRYGKLTSIRVIPPPGTDLTTVLQDYEATLRKTLDPMEMGLTAQSVKERSLQASRGATDFGEYFTYFSFFLVVSALLLTTLFFKLGVEQRLREIGLLRAIGFSTKQVRSLFLREGLALATLGAAAGLIGAVAYGALMMFGLRTWWVGAVGTTLLELRVTPQSLLTGALSGIVTALVCVWWTLRSLRESSPRSLLAGSAGEIAGKRGTPGNNETRGTLAGLFRVFRLFRVFIFGGLGVILLIAAALNLVGQSGGFFGAGTLLLIAILFFWSSWLRSDRNRTIQGQGAWPMARMGFRNATTRPGRSVLCIALIASAAFIIVSVDAFRRDGRASEPARNSGAGGYPLMAESLLPIVHDPNSRQGREELNLNDDKLAGVKITRFRLRPGDDASCLNLYQPRNPRILGAPDDFISESRFAFQSSLARTAEEKANPWILLNANPGDGVIPVAADANSLTYVLHLKLGDELAIDASDGAPVRLRMVAALADSVFQGELLMSEANFKKLFPDHEGYRFFLIDGATEKASEIAAALEDNLSDFGFDAIGTEEKLAGFHQVENTYLSTFQTLGGLGLLLGTFGLAAVLLRNVLERRRELALMRAVGYRSSHLSLIVIAENALLLGCGLLTGVLCALLAIIPAVIDRGGRLSVASLGLLLLAVLLTGLAASLVAVRAAVRSPLLPALRTE